MKYVALMIYPNGDKWWSASNVKELAEETLQVHHAAYGAIGTVIATKEFDENACIF